MKKLVYALILACAMAACSQASAAPGDATLYQGINTGFGISGAQCMTFMNDTVYASTYEQAIYAIDASGAGDMIKYDLIDLDSDNLNYQMRIEALVADEGELHALAVEYGYNETGNVVYGALLTQLSLKGDEAMIKGAVELDWDYMIDINDGFESSRNVSGAFLKDGKLVFTSFDAMGNNQLFVFDANTGEVELPRVANLAAACPYKPGYALVMTYSYGQGDSAILAMDLDTLELTGIAEIDQSVSSAPYGPAYNAKTDTLYYVINNEIFAHTLSSGQKPEVVNYIEMSEYENAPTALTSDGFYVAASMGSIYKRNLNPEARSQKRLTLANMYASLNEEAHNAFTAKHPDADVIRKDYGGDIITDMLMRSSDIDIYAIDVSSPEYAALLKRGYMAPLSGAAAELVMSMYPNLKRPLMSEGEVVALPLHMYANSIFINPKALEGMGLGDADIPGTVPELYRLIARLPDILEQTPEYDAFEPDFDKDALRDWMFTILMESWMTHINTLDAADKHMDTPVMLEALTAFEQIDFSKVGYTDNSPQSDGGFGFSYDESMVLFKAYKSVNARAYNKEEGEPLPLALGEGLQPVIPTELTVAFVNPYSENRELALEYLNMTAQHMDTLTLIHLSPENNRPLRYSFYESTLSDYRDRLEDYRARLETAQDEQRAELAQIVEQYEQSIQDYIDVGGWEVTEESIARYQRYAPLLSVNMNIGLSAENLPAFMAETMRYLFGEIDKQTMLKNVDKTLTMMLMEDY